MLEHALEYASTGFRVLPVHGVVDGHCTCPRGASCAARGKHPRLGAWTQHATTEEHVVRQWWAQWPTTNVGLAMGGEERLVALDIDGEKGRASLAELEAAHGPLPLTLTSVSGRAEGGEHRLFRVPDHLAIEVLNRVGFMPGLDTRGEGAQIVAPPSVHASGRRYAWKHVVPIAELPRWLHDRVAQGAPRRLPSPRVQREVDQHFDIGDLRRHLVDYRRRLAGTGDPVDEERSWIAGQILAGEAFAVPGDYVGETTLLRGRDAALNQAMSILAWRLPVDVPPDVAIEMVRASVADMICDPEGYEHWMMQAADKFHRSCARRAAVHDAEQRAQQATLLALNERRRAAGMPEVHPRGEPDQHASGDEDEGVESVEDDLAIVVAVGELPRMVSDAVRVLALRDENLYQRAGELVMLAREPQRTEEHVGPARRTHHQLSILLRPGTPRLRPVPAPLLTVRLAAAAKWVRQQKAKQKGAPARWIEQDPDPKTVAGVLAAKDWPGIRPLRGIVETPIFTPSHRLVTEAGYEPETTFVHLPSVQFEAVPERPTQQDAQDALRRLWIDLFCDFPYRGMPAQDQEDATREARFEHARACPDAFAAVALLLTILARPAIQGAVPGVVFEASTQGSGKSLQIHIVSQVATGRSASFATFPIGRDGKPNEEELEKLLGSYAIAGTQVVAFDNIKGLLGGPGLEKVQTAVDSVALRVLGSLELRLLPWSAVMAFSGNNMAMTDDTAQRNLISRLESSLEDPRGRDKREYLHPNLLAWIEQNRGRLVRDALIILRAWAVAEEKPDAGNLGSFEAWSAVIPSALLYAGGPNILLARSRDGSADDQESEAHATLLMNWPFNEPLKASDIVNKLFDSEATQSRNAPKGYDEMRGAIRELTGTPDGKKPNPSTFGYCLRKLRDKIRNGLKITGKQNRENTIEWRVVRVS